MTEQDKARDAMKKVERLLNCSNKRKCGCTMRMDSFCGECITRIEKLVKRNAALEHAEAENAERMKVLVDRLADCIAAIKTLPIDCFGFGETIDRNRQWPIRDELIGRAEKALAKDRGKQ